MLAQLIKVFITSIMFLPSVWHHGNSSLFLFSIHIITAGFIFSLWHWDHHGTSGWVLSSWQTYMCSWPSTDFWLLMCCCVSSYVFACIQVESKVFDIERVGHIQTRMEKLACHDLSGFYWLWIGHDGG